ncbi:hypothetical protein GURASL_06920 [Geotalea uraniireducens]|uniref:DUF721 domain-containing protein n=1 Tax=Geotalea uraniireducens TaxID=351604 RepID=A0ABM8EH66_9BACT|nr:DUF721 domain-containing protein [Geotalea uraniireducens]BDV41769.1 hypothetical protein GURASL_06920 [Geotalea uraniireducens]
MTESRPRLPRPLAVTDLLADALRGKPAERCLREGRIWLVWESVVGEQIATKARPVKFRDGTLTVAVYNAPWMQQLNFLKGKIVQALNRALGEELVREIYLRAGTLPPAIAAEHGRTAAPRRPLSAEETAWVGTMIDTIDDRELAQALGSLLERHLAGQEQLPPPPSPAKK